MKVADSTRLRNAHAKFRQAAVEAGAIELIEASDMYIVLLDSVEKSPSDVNMRALDAQFDKMNRIAREMLES